MLPSPFFKFHFPALFKLLLFYTFCLKKVFHSLRDKKRFVRKSKRLFCKFQLFFPKRRSVYFVSSRFVWRSFSNDCMTCNKNRLSLILSNIGHCLINRF